MNAFLGSLLGKVVLGLAFIGCFYIALNQYEHAKDVEAKYNDTILLLKHQVAKADTVRGADIIHYRIATGTIRTDTVHDSISVEKVKEIVAKADTVIFADSVAIASRDSLITKLENPPSAPRLIPSASLLLSSDQRFTLRAEGDYRITKSIYATAQLDVNARPMVSVGITVRF